MDAKYAETFSEAREVARRMATTKLERVMIDAALALFLDKLRETHTIEPREGTIKTVWISGYRSEPAPNSPSA